MSYVDSQLLPGETVRYRARLHRGIFTTASVFGVLTAAALVVAISAGHWWWLLVAVGATVAAFTFGRAWVTYNSSEFAVTNKRVVIKVGWVRRQTLETMLSKVEGVGVDQSLTGRMLGYGSIEVTGTGGTKEEFTRIADPLEFRRQVQAAISASDDARAAVSAPAAGYLPADREERECPYCAERILVKAKVCRFCGRDVSAVAPT
ncbi:MAG TPA: PH domain-containing protein [Gemmatimonadaceae bacterium]|jgi:uncharacterized membrane protein YdbT with pleckstrin-like domain